VTRTLLKRVGAGIVLMVALVGCRGQGQANAVPMQASVEPYPEAPAGDEALAQSSRYGGGVVGGLPARGAGGAGRVGGGVAPAPPAGRQAGATVPVPPGRKLIRDAQAVLEVASVERALTTLRAQVESAGGYVAAQSQSRDHNARSANRGDVTLRLPAAKLDAFMAGLASLGTVEQARTTAGDITEEYFDLELRLNNQRQLQDRLVELLNRAGNKLSDLLEAERELARVRGEIEQMEGRQRFWDNRVSLATLTVTVHEPMPTVASAEGGPFAALRHSFSQAADNFVYAIAGVIAFTGGLIPIAAAVLLGLWILVKLWKARRRSK